MPTWSAVAEGVGLDSRLGPHFLRAGIGYGGSCFPKDSLALKQLASNSGYHFQLLSAVIEVNELQKRRVIGKLKRHLRPAARKDRRAPRPRVQAEHRRHARGAVDRARVATPRRGRGRARVGSRRARRRQASERGGARRDRARRRARGGRCRDRHGVGRAQGARVGRGARRDGEPVDRRRPEPARSRDDASRRLRLRRRRTSRAAPSDVAPHEPQPRPGPDREGSACGGDHPRRRPGRAAR